MKQQTQEWKDFRKTKIGASDAAPILGISPWKTPYQLWQEKVCGTEEESTPSMQRGLDLEPVARAAFEKEIGVMMMPKVVLNPKLDWQFASLDGISLDEKMIVEIKCASKEVHEMAKQKKLPEYYEAQIQHQMSVCGLDQAYYFSFHDNKGVVVEVKRNQAFIDDMCEKEEKFWKKHILQKEAPDLSNKDYLEVKVPEGEALLADYFSLCEQEKTLGKRKDDIKSKIINFSPSQNFILNGTKVYQTQTASYDTKKMREEGINIEIYKKFSKPFWKISTR